MPTTEERLAALEGTLGTLIANLLEPALVGPYATFGDGGIIQFNNSGMQVRTAAAENFIWGVTTFDPDPENSASPTRAFIAVENDNTDATWEIKSSADDGNRYARVLLESLDSATTAMADLRARAVGQDVRLQLIADDGTPDDPRLIASGGPFQLPSTENDYANLDDDGMLQYATGAHKIRARINSATVNLATETYASGLITTHEAAADPHTGYLKENDANWTDLTDGGATTLHTHAENVALIFIIDGGGSAITTGVKGYLEVPFGMTITGWTLVAKESGSIVIDVWKDTYANFPPVDGDSIAGTELPTLSTAQKNQDVALSSWTTAITAGDVLGFNVDSITTCTQCTLTIRGTRP